MALSTDTGVFDNLTNEESILVDRFASKNTDGLPKFFNAGTQSIGEEPEEPISREFEAFLILQALKGADKLSAANKWFDQAASLQLIRRDRDLLLEEAFSAERTDATAKFQELHKLTEAFSTFRSTFQHVDVTEPDENFASVPAERFSTVPEIALIMRDSQAVMGEIATKLDRASFRAVHNEVLIRDKEVRLKTQDFVGGIADIRIEAELLSWREVITQIQSRVVGVV